MADRKYEVQVKTTTDTKALDALIKKIKDVKSNVAVKVDVDKKNLESIQKDLSKLGDKKIKVSIDTTDVQKDLKAVETQMAKIQSKTIDIKSNLTQTTKTVQGPQGQGNVANTIFGTPHNINATGIAQVKAIQNINSQLEKVWGTTPATQKRPTSNIDKGKSAEKDLKKREDAVVKSNKKIEKSNDTLADSNANLLKTFIGSEAIGQIGNVMSKVAEDYSKAATKLRGVNDVLADEFENSAETLKKRQVFLQSVTQSTLLGASVGGAPGAIGAAIAATAISLFNTVEERARDLLVIQEQLKAVQKDILKDQVAFLQETARNNSVDILKKYNDELQNTLDIQNRLNSARLFSSNDELARALDELNAEKLRIANERKLLQDNTRITEAQRVRGLSNLDEKEAGLQQAFDIKAAEQPVKAATAALDNLTTTADTLQKSLNGQIKSLEELAKLNREFEALSKALLAAQTLRDSGSDNTETIKALTKRRDTVKSRIKELGDIEIMLAEAKTLQQKKEDVENDIANAQEVLRQTEITAARVKANIVTTGGITAAGRDISRSIDLTKTQGNQAQQDRETAAIQKLTETLGNVSTVFDKIVGGKDPAESQRLRDLERMIADAIRDGIISTKDFTDINTRAKTLGVAENPDIRKLIQTLLEIARTERTVGNNSSVPAAARAAVKSGQLPPEVNRFIAEIANDSEITLDELARLRQVQQDSGTKNSDSMNRLISIAEQQLEGANALALRIAKVEAAVKAQASKLK